MELCELFLESGGFSKGACFLGLRAGAGALPLYPTRASAALYPVRAIGP